MRSNVYALLENRHIYNLTQAVLAPHAVQNLRSRLAPYLRFNSDRTIRALELGCGTGDFSLDLPHIRYSGTDVNPRYFPSRTNSPRMSYEVMDATCLTFPDSSFDLVYSVGLYHHLSDEQVQCSLREADRVLAAGGKFLLVDNIWPTQPWNVWARWIRQYDRGEHVRSQHEIEGLVAAAGLTVNSVESFRYTWTGLEGVIVQLCKD
jgi:SAM-dependent methyltransferase